MTPGRLLYLLYHRPKASVQHLLRNRDWGDQWKTRQGEAAMRRAAADMRPPTVASDRPAVQVHLLTGTRFWHQSMFCLWSLAETGRQAVHPVLHDDGSLTATQQAHFRRVFPSVQFNYPASMHECLETHLPRSRFPLLRQRWEEYPHIRKLINPHLGTHGAKLVLDSDLLFFRRADILFDWLAQPDSPLHAVDCETAYGYPLDMMARLAGHTLSPKINVGITGLRSEDIDWERLEHWVIELQATHGSSYLQEQGLIAMMMAGQDCTIAPEQDYVTKPVEPEASSCRAIMHHYVADSKRTYFQSNWQHVLSL